MTFKSILIAIFGREGFDLIIKNRQYIAAWTLLNTVIGAVASIISIVSEFMWIVLYGSTAISVILFLYIAIRFKNYQYACIPFLYAIVFTCFSGLYIFVENMKRDLNETSKAPQFASIDSVYYESDRIHVRFTIASKDHIGAIVVACNEVTGVDVPIFNDRISDEDRTKSALLPTKTFAKTYLVSGRRTNNTFDTIIEKWDPVEGKYLGIRDIFKGRKSCADLG